MVLQSHTKDRFASTIASSLSAVTKSLRSLTVSPTTLSWHPNHERTRWFLVLRVSRPTEDGDALNKLLDTSNEVAREFGGPVLYTSRHRGQIGIKDIERVDAGRGLGKSSRGQRQLMDASGDKEGSVDVDGAFHISIGWSLSPQNYLDEAALSEDPHTAEVMKRAKEMQVIFADVKVRLGKDVTSIPFGRTRQAKGGILG